MAGLIGICCKPISVCLNLPLESPNPSNRCLPVRSCCIAACLRSRFLAMSLSSEVISASASDSTSAIASCSGSGGRIQGILANAFFVSL